MMAQNVFDIPTMNPDKDFVEVMECDYKGEHYSVRDNGAIMRHAKDRKRPNDNKWTFGHKDSEKGYMCFCNEAVHRIVATAFHGEAPSSQHVVDHIDTNRCNNRPTNLRWLTKLENILLNEFTRAKVEYICGSIEAFLANPQLLYGHESEDPNFAWMKTVTKEEAANTLANLKRLKLKTTSKSETTNAMGNWVYDERFGQWQPHFTNRDKPNSPSKEPERPNEPQTVADLQFTGGNLGRAWDMENPFEYADKKSQEDNAVEEKQPLFEYYETSNKLAVQHGFAPYTNPEFLCCPDTIVDDPIKEYVAQLIEGKVFVSTTYGNSIVYKFTIYDNQILVVTKISNGFKNFGLIRVTWNGEVFTHESMETFFDENGALAAFTRAQGLEWNGPDSIDDYC